MSKYHIEYEFDLKFCDSAMYDMLTACGFNEYPATNTGTIKIQIESSEMPTKQQQIEFIRKACRDLIGTKTKEGMVALAVRFSRINEAYLCEDEKKEGCVS